MSEPIQIIIFQLIGAAAIVVFFRLQRKKKRLLENGLEVKGIILEYDDITINHEDAYPVIRFITRDGKCVTEKTHVAPPGKLKQGQEITVIYHPDNPREFIYKTSFDTSKMYYVALIFGILFISLGLWSAYKYITGDT